MSLVDAPAPRAGRLRLWAEFGALFAGVPLAMAFALPTDALWTIVPAATLVGLGLLFATPGFSWRELHEGPLVGGLPMLLATTACTAVIAAGLTLWLRPHGFLSLPRHATELWLTILLLYPFLSALPQEIMFRALFFRRYGALFPSRRIAIAANAAFFGLAHLFLWNWVALAMTTAGGAIFAVAYLDTGRGRNLMFATLLHAVAGAIVFTSGLGTFFYHGAVR